MRINQLTIRSCESRDEGLLLKWRNDPASILWSRSRRPVGVEEHARWFQSVFFDPNIQIFIGFFPNMETKKNQEDSVGMVRFERETEAWCVSIYVHPFSRGRGVARELLGGGIEMLSNLSNGRLDLIAWVHEANAPSKQLFASAGFRFDRQEGEFVRMKRSPQTISET